MNIKQLQVMKNSEGFVAALDQSGGSTPKALAAYGIDSDTYHSEQEMYKLVHDMRTRIITSPAFNRDKILASILFEVTMDSKIEGVYTADYLWEKKGIVPLLKIDEGLQEREQGVQLMKPLSHLSSLLTKAKERHIFGTKMRSVIYEANPEGIKQVVKQQFDVAKEIIAQGLVPIIEPEVDIHAKDKVTCESLLLKGLKEEIEKLPSDSYIMIKLTIPSTPDYYADLLQYDCVLRLLALSGGYNRDEANQLLHKNPSMIASFSRALAQGLTAQQSDDEFNQTISESIDTIFSASKARKLG